MTSEGVGETFSININVSGAVDLYGWEFYLGWNATLLQALNVTEGGFLEQGGDTFFYPKINNTEGSMLVDCTLLGDIPGVDGHGILVTVQFSVEASGVSDLDLYETTLVSSLQQDIPHTTSDGSFSTTREKVAGIDHPQGYRPAH
ncbi:hypothetical protein GWN63_01760 [Candidatus Bathyarchaeota archaeon]|nr:hypothetical protein [Candidatus Bathyarchaeota archaeon]NIR12755.1 hypothetical protein [Desulfobacterales bacterium]NIU80962.1 hypothetical protein [Candidatus Bathyarchaeota archaeon]NIV67613.1 hypothetical protein [Candidatus Bathyarchaeota archaeon]NIW34241.1 hypothetical protein [Candidatus Bathyarchaeota archaeon]